PLGGSPGSARDPPRSRRAPPVSGARPRRAAGHAPPRPSGHTGAAPRRPRAGTPRRPARDRPRPGRPRASYRRVLAFPRRRELALEPGDLDEALRGLVRERLAGRVGG